LVAAIAFAWVRLAWYPGVLFEATSSGKPMALVAAVLLVAGPLATLAVFVPGKRGLGFDLVVIGSLQALALAFGLWTLFEARRRPTWLSEGPLRAAFATAISPPPRCARGASPYLQMAACRPVSRVPGFRASASSSSASCSSRRTGLDRTTCRSTTCRTMRCARLRNGMRKSCETAADLKPGRPRTASMRCPGNGAARGIARVPAMRAGERGPARCSSIAANGRWVRITALSSRNEEPKQE
jgi:hypothetical protein